MTVFCVVRDLQAAVDWFALRKSGQSNKPAAGGPA